MVEHISRREFLRKSIGAGTAMGLSGLDRIACSFCTLTDGIKCKKCGVENIGYETALNLLMPGNHVLCSNCGVQLDYGRFFAETKCYSSCLSVSRSMEKEVPCCQIPFPNHSLIKGSCKPRLVLSELDF